MKDSQLSGFGGELSGENNQMGIPMTREWFRLYKAVAGQLRGVTHGLQTGFITVLTDLFPRAGLCRYSPGDDVNSYTQRYGMRTMPVPPR